MSETREPILSAEGLVKSYGRRRVVDGVVLDVMPGEIVGLLGPNGAGKTTTFRMICGQVKPDRGRVFLGSAEVTRWPMYLRSRQGGMGYLPQKSSVFAKLSCEKTNCLSVSISRIFENRKPEIFPVANVVVWRLLAVWSPIQRSLCSTSRLLVLIRSRCRVFRS